MNTARPPDSALSGASAPEAVAASAAGELGAVTEAASADVPEEAVAAAGMPEATAAVAVPSGSPVSDFMIHRVARALRERVRYRYVAPRVLREGESFRIQSPCCSRNVDPSGGLIDIALLTPGAAGAGGGWSLSARDHAAGSWVQRMSGEPLDTVLDALCVDSERQFWP